MLLPILFFAVIGVLAGVILTAADKIFRVDIDETQKQVIEALPGINCGSCGYASCARYAEAIMAGTAANQCKPGGEKVVEKLAEILGTEVSVAEPEAAIVHCSGTCDVKYRYKGTNSCRASQLYYNGKGNCRFACAGLGDCVSVCPNDAVKITDGRAIIEPHKCIACGLCVKACPKGLITIQKVSRSVHVNCSSKDTGKVTKSFCTSGCIGCKICEKKCPNNAIIVKENLAHINYDSCDSCGVCVDSCPVKCIGKQTECAFGNNAK